MLLPLACTNSGMCVRQQTSKHAYMFSDDVLGCGDDLLDSSDTFP